MSGGLAQHRDAGAVAVPSVPDVELRGVTKRFGGTTAVDDLDLTVARGEFLALLGPSGCGKTTCLRLVAGFEEPDAGDLLVGGRSVLGLAPAKREVNTVFQSYALFGHLDVRRNVEFGLRQQRVPGPQRRRRAMEALEMVHLGHLADRRPRELSGGQQQRVALARALVLRPRVLLLDEPLAALDLQLRKEMQVELRRLHREVGATFVFVTHDQGEAMAMADRVAVLRDGRIEQLDRPAVVYDAPATRFVASFIGDMNVVEQGGAVVGVRPERVGVSAVPRHSGGAGLRATVLDVQVLGDAVVVRTEVPGGAPVTARRPRAEQTALAALGPGSDVLLTWSREHAVALGGPP